MNVIHFRKAGLTILSTCFLFSIYCQEPNQYIGDLINATNWFELEKTYPKVKNQLQVEVLKSLSEMMLNVSFDNPEEVIKSADYVLEHHQEELGFESILSALYFRAKALYALGRYQEGAGFLNGVFEQMAGHISEQDLPAHAGLKELLNYYKNEKAPELIRPAHDVEIPFVVEPAGSGFLMFVPVSIDNTTYSFIFDTGAETSFMSERFAKEVGVRIVGDNLAITGTGGTSSGLAGIIDEMKIGDIFYRNVPVSISRANPAVDTVYMVDAVLGIDFMKALGEVNIYPREEKIVFPTTLTPLPASGRNLMYRDYQPQLLAYYNNEPIELHFDTGNARGELHYPFYTRYKEQIEANGKKEEMDGGGFGGIFKTPVYIVDELTFNIAGKEVTFQNIPVETETTFFSNPNKSGAVGRNLVEKCQKIVINLHDMFVDIEI
ncbi:MAG: retroviral-like aspartic protease family protein [Tannerellaceae bacterium]|nr:retroviral-like aspartic protease family protein [Tannerellaceae bacterium]